MIKMILEPVYNDYDEIYGCIGEDGTLVICADCEWSGCLLRGGRRTPGTTGIEYMSVHVCGNCGDVVGTASTVPSAAKKQRKHELQNGHDVSVYDRIEADDRDIDWPWGRK